MELDCASADPIHTSSNVANGYQWLVGTSMKKSVVRSFCSALDAALVNATAVQLVAAHTRCETSTTATLKRNLNLCSTSDLRRTDNISFRSSFVHYDTVTKEKGVFKKRRAGFADPCHL